MLRNTTNRKTDIRICEKLPNGQLMNLYFKRWQGNNIMQWSVGLYISSTRKEANMWWNKRPKHNKSRITGDGSLNGLCLAFKYIMEVVHSLGINEELVVEWEDERRKSAYRILKRYGFRDYHDIDNGEAITGYGIRNPKYWTWKDDAE
jgi:hypothetical protein